MIVFIIYIKNLAFIIISFCHIHPHIDYYYYYYTAMNIHNNNLKVDSYIEDNNHNSPEVGMYYDNMKSRCFLENRNYKSIIISQL